MLKVYAYNNSSAGAKALAEALGVRILKHVGSKYRSRLGDKIINWGSSDVPIQYEHGIINHPRAVANAKNKLTTLRILQLANVSVPPFTTDPLEASLFTGKVVCRHTLFGKGGEGIEVVEPGTRPFPIAPLYTTYIKKKSEFRIHVAFGRIIDMQQKKRRHDAPPGDGIVRNLDNGYVFVRNNIRVPQKVQEQALGAVEALSLDFGGVDVIYNEHFNTAYVLEVNTAPGLEGTTVQKYREVFERFK